MRSSDGRNRRSQANGRAQATAISNNGLIVGYGETVDGETSAFLLTPTPECFCEWDGNSTAVDVFDLLSYLADWFSASSAAECDRNGVVDVFDLRCYLDCWFSASSGGACS